MTGDRRRRLERVADRLHPIVAISTLWLILTSPWVVLRRTIPGNPGFFDLMHVGIGVAMAVIAVVYLWANTAAGRWRQYFPWLAGNLAEVRTDLAGLTRGRIPAAGGAGLFSLIEGLLLLALLTTALTGAGWLAADGSRTALAWREWHIVAADVFIAVLVVHIIAAGAHLLEFLRD